MAVTDQASLLSLAIRLNLISNDQARECRAESQSPSVEDTLRILERKGYLTPWQGAKLVKGEEDGYFLGGYRLLYIISAGSFGRVYRADVPSNGEVVALKVLRKRWVDSPHKVELFEREGKMGMSIQHPNIVAILAVGKDAKSGQHFIVMEFVEGGTLKDILVIRKKLTLDESLKMLEDCTSGLAFAHSRGMTHRDIKPTNILVSASKVCKLVDFGLAELSDKSEKRSNEESPVDQSVDYAALELFAGSKPGDVRSDIYFLGCVLFEMLTGASPLEKTKDPRARKKRGRFEILEKITANPEVPKEVLPLLNKMVALDPEERYQTPAQLLDAIRLVRAELAGEPLPGTSRATAGMQTVYVVENNSKLQDAFRKKLKDKGYRVLISSEASRATQRFQQQPYHSLIMDVGSTGPDGIEEFARVMREADKVKSQLSGILIFNEDQTHLESKVPSYPGVKCLVRPVTMRQIYQALGIPDYRKDDQAQDTPDD